MEEFGVYILAIILILDCHLFVSPKMHSNKAAKDQLKIQ